MRRRRAGHGHDRRAAELIDVDGGGLEALLRAEERLVLVAFWTPGCEPCRELRPELERLADEQGDLCRVVAVDASREGEAIVRHAVREFPTLVFFKRGRELHRFKGGALPGSILDYLSR